MTFIKHQKSRVFLALVLLAIAAAGSAKAVEAAMAARPLAGAWILVRADNVAVDGTRTMLYGPDPQGFLTFDDHGRYALQILRVDRPKFASGDKAKGSTEEYRAAVTGSNAHFGRYVVDPAARTLTFHIDHASFPNWEGTVQVRRFTLMGDHLTYVVPVPTSGAGVVGEVEWRRAD